MDDAKVKEQRTIKVSVEVMSWLKEDFDHDGWDKLVLDQEISQDLSIMDLLQQLAKKYPKFNRKAFADASQSLHDYCAVVLNGRFLSSIQDLNTKLNEGDDIKLIPGFYGG
jgi:molybdopterin converting factor small subunit